MAERGVTDVEKRTENRSDGDGAAAQGPGFDQVLERLRLVVERLEAGSLSLEDSLRAFEEGVGLSRRGAAILDAAERRVEILTRGTDGGERIVPFSPGEGEGSR
jgi:exodeoxyribonuclease VII small subunit